MFNIPMNNGKSFGLGDLTSLMKTGQGTKSFNLMQQVQQAMQQSRASAPMGQPQTNGFGQPQPNSFGQPNTGFGQVDNGFGQPNNGFGQTGGSFGANPNTGFGQDNGFNQQPSGFNQQPSGFGQPNNGFAQPSGFSQPSQPQGFSQPSQPQGLSQPNTGFSQSNTGFSQSNTGFNQQPQAQPRQRTFGNGVVLKKGQKTSLSQMCPGLDLIQVGLGWDLGPGGVGYDLDVEAFMLGANGRVIGDDWFVFYNQPNSPDNSIQLLCDSTTGAGDGDDEIIQVKLSQVNPQVAKIIFIVSINEAKERGYNFSNVANAYVRITDVKTGRELVRFSLTDYYSTVCSMMVGEVYKHNNEWKFNPIGDGTSDDLIGLCTRYGVNIA